MKWKENSFYLPPVFENGGRYCAGGIVLGSVAVSAVSSVSADVLLYISVAIKASFFKLGMCNICKNNIAKMFLDFFKIKIVHVIEVFKIFGKKSSAQFYILVFDTHNAVGHVSNTVVSTFNKARIMTTKQLCK